MPLNCGIVGLPNVGKSTIFNALTSAKAQAANYPFCTIDPNTGVVTVPDERLDKISKLIKPKSLVPTTMEFIDIAGLVEGASKGEGLGNQFLGHIRSTDAVLHVVRCFADPEVVHVAGGVNPLHDIDIINTELLLADLDTVDKRYAKVEKLNKPANAEHKIKVEFTTLSKLKQALEAGKPARTVELTEEEKPYIRDLHLITAKPLLYVANVDEAQITRLGPMAQAVFDHAARENSRAIAFNGKIEAEFAGMSDEDVEMFRADYGITSGGLDRSIVEAYDLLGLMTFLTTGEKETRAWTIEKGTKAPQAAGKIHSDIERGFIRAEIISTPITSPTRRSMRCAPPAGSVPRARST